MQPDNSTTAVIDEPTVPQPEAGEDTEPEQGETEAEPSPILDPAFDHLALARRFLAAVTPSNEAIEDLEKAGPDEATDDEAIGGTFVAMAHALVDIAQSLRDRNASGGVQVLSSAQESAELAAVQERRDQAAY